MAPGIWARSFASAVRAVFWIAGAYGAMNAASCAAGDTPFGFVTSETLAEIERGCPTARFGTLAATKLTVNRIQVYSSGGGRAMSEGAGGLAAISVDVSPWLLLLVLVVVIVGGVKLVKLLWAMFS